MSEGFATIGHLHGPRGAALGMAGSQLRNEHCAAQLYFSVPFGEAATPPELRFAFAQLLELFQGQGSKSEVLSELFWAGLHGIAELTRTKRFPRIRQKERVRTLVEALHFPKMKRHRW